MSESFCTPDQAAGFFCLARGQSPLDAEDRQALAEMCRQFSEAGYEAGRADQKALDRKVVSQIMLDETDIDTINKVLEAIDNAYNKEELKHG